MPADNQNAGEGDREPSYKDSLLLSVGELFFTPKYSDLTIICEDRKWHVHKAIVCSRSEAFATMCDIGMKESNENVITLEEDHPSAVDAMLFYMYSADYFVEKQSRLAPMVLDVVVHAVADKYNVPGLTKLAAAKFSKRAYAEWKTKCCEFAAAIHDVYTGAADRDHELRDCILEICSTNAKALFEDEAFEQFREVVQTVPAFAAELCAKTASLVPAPEPTSSVPGYRCCRCGWKPCWKSVDLATTYVCFECNRSSLGVRWLELMKGAGQI